MAAVIDHACTPTDEHLGADVEGVYDLAQMTPEMARRLATLLAPHLVAMRAVTAGTPYGGDGPSAAVAPPMSPATAIFIAGMLERLPA